MDLDCLDWTQTLGEILSPYSCPCLFVSQGSWEFICLFLSAGQTQTPLRPLLTVGRDEVLLMIVESLGAVSRTMSFWFCGLGCSYHPRASGSFPINCFATGTSSKGWIRVLNSLKESISPIIGSVFLQGTHLSSRPSCSDEHLLFQAVQPSSAS